MILTNTCTSMHIYTELSEDHASCLYHINTISYSKNSKELSFCAKVMIFHTTFLKNKEKHAGMPQKYSFIRHVGLRQGQSLTNLLEFCLHTLISFSIFNIYGFIYYLIIEDNICLLLNKFFSMKLPKQSLLQTRTLIR